MRRRRKNTEVNRETAMNLWNKQFGKAIKAVDFAGRELAKSAYNDRNSKFGWNIDHILPKSRGGKAAEHNLVCCNIRTNDEKADKFPVFRANDRYFELRKREDYYEIHEKERNERSQILEEETEIDFMDPAQGLSFWQSCRKPTAGTCVGYVKIKVTLREESEAFMEKFRVFIDELFQPSMIFAEADKVKRGRESGSRNRKSGRTSANSSKVCVFTLLDFDLPFKEDTEKLLERCVMLNTYGEYYFEENYHCRISIYCGMEIYDSAMDLSFAEVEADVLSRRTAFREPLAIDELIRINTGAEDETDGGADDCGYYAYDYTFTKLKENLKQYSAD